MEYPYNSSLSDGSYLIILARKRMIKAWIVFIVISILLNVFFIAEWWSIAIRTSLIVYPIYKSVKYYKIKKKEKKWKAQDSFQKTNVKNPRSFEFPYISNNSSHLGESDRLISARKQMNYTWIGFIIVEFILNVFFLAEMWSIVIRSAIIVYPVYISVKYYKIKNKEKKLKGQELIQKTNVKNTRFSFNSNSYDSSGIPESETLFTARKQMIFAWIAFIIIQIVLNVFFLGDGWSIGTRSAIIVYPVYKSVKYGKIKKEEMKFKTQKSSQRKYVNTNEASILWLKI
ncbi:MAG: hypothetical protein ACTSPA_00175 [Promethearchaeota archaeon]